MANTGAVTESPLTQALEASDDVKPIASELGETEPGPIAAIAAIVEGLGIMNARNLAQAARLVHEAGSLNVYWKHRRKHQRKARSLGGIFFFLVRHHPDGGPLVPYPVVPVVDKTGSDSRYPTIAWVDRAKIDPAEKGEVSTVKIVVTGCPGQITRANGYVALVLSQRKVPSLPNGLPQPPPTPTDYLVFISDKQWRKVESPVQAPDDLLIVEGWCAFDGETERIVVWATNTTTRSLQKAHRESMAARA